MTTSQLVDYGIETEQSDIRAHVSVVNRSIYVFPTADGVAAVQGAIFPLRPAYQPDVEGATAEGWLVPIKRIQNLRRLSFQTFAWEKFHPTMSTSEKGALAVECVAESMRLGRFPFWVDAQETERREIQIKGTDIIVFCHKRVQVKCDWRCGDQPAGTGNLFLQKAERNPLKRI